MIDLSIIILSYNTKELLKECLVSLKNNKLRTKNNELIVVDNASSDGSAEEIKNAKLKMQNDNVKFKMILNTKNLGYTKANNQGIQIASGRYILFLNADTLIYERTLASMVKFMEEHKDAGAATCRVELPTGRLDDSCHRGFPTPWRSFCYFSGLARIFPRSRIFAGYSLNYLDLNTIHEIDSCSGAFMIVRREAGQEIGWWDEDFFWYGDDLDFCYRLKEKARSAGSGQGWKVYFVPTVKILHYKGVSGGIKDISKHLTIATRETVIRATNARFEAMRLFYKKHYMDKYPRVITWFVLLGINLKQRFALLGL